MVFFRRGRLFRSYTVLVDHRDGLYREDGDRAERETKEAWFAVTIPLHLMHLRTRLEGTCWFPRRTSRSPRPHRMLIGRVTADDRHLSTKRRGYYVLVSLIRTWVNEMRSFFYK